MDFIGMRKSEQEIGNSSSIYSSHSLLYDQRFRKRIFDDYESSQLLGMIFSEREKTEGETRFEKKTFFETDAYRRMTLICEYYFFMKPKYMAVTNNTLCDPNRESFRYWLAGVTNRVRFGTTSRLYSLKSIRQPDTIDNRESFDLSNQLFRNFVRLPSEVLLRAELGSLFGLPVIANRDASDDLIEKWLNLMTWVKTVNAELHPTLCKLRGNLEGSALDGIISGNLEGSALDGIISGNKSDLLFSLQRLYDRCTELKATSDVNLNNFFTNEYRKLIKEKSDLPRLKIPKQKHREFLRCILTASIDITSSVITYLSEIQSHDEHTCFALCQSQITAKVIDVNKTITRLLRKKYIYSKFEVEKCTQSLLRAIESIIKVYYRRKFRIMSTFGKQHEIRQRMLHRIQKFMRKLTEGISSSLIQTLCEYYKPSLKKEYSKRIIKSILLHIIWTAMNVVLNSTNFSGGDAKLPSLQHLARPLDISNADVITGRPILLESIKKMCSGIRICEMNIFYVRSEITGQIGLPISYVYNDFPLYLKAFSGTDRCCHSILELDSLTDGRLKKFMTELVVCLHCNISGMEEVLEHAREYLRFYVSQKDEML